MLLYLYEGMGKHGGLCFFFFDKRLDKKAFYNAASCLVAAVTGNIYMYVYICIYTYFIDVYASRLVW